MSSIGFIVNAGGFTATIDYWNFDFKDPFQIEIRTRSSTRTPRRTAITGAPGAPTAELRRCRSTSRRLAVPPSRYRARSTYTSSTVDNSRRLVSMRRRSTISKTFSAASCRSVARGPTRSSTHSDDFKDIGGTTLRTGRRLRRLDEHRHAVHVVAGPQGQRVWRSTCTVRIGSRTWFAMSPITRTPARVDRAVAGHRLDRRIRTLLQRHVVQRQHAVVAGSVMNLTDEDPPSDADEPELRPVHG